MGAWGTGPLENDEAEDFATSLARARKDRRLARIVAAVDDYMAFDARLAAGTNVTVLGEADIAELRQSRVDTLAWYASIGEEPPLALLGWETEEDFEAEIAELSRPQVQDGGPEGLRLRAAAHVLGEALAGRRSALAGVPAADLVAPARACAGAMRRLLANPLFAATWRPDDYARLARDTTDTADALELAGGG